MTFHNPQTSLATMKHVTETKLPAKKFPILNTKQLPHSHPVRVLFSQTLSLKHPHR
jgi:hypothetical protein